MSDLRVRRATLEDMEPLGRLWEAMHFEAGTLARRVTEFQVAETPAGNLVGAVGIQILERQGIIHSEGFVDFALADRARPALWDRLNAIALSHGLLRLWTREQAPFWSHCGMSKADADALKKLPAVWQGSADWLTIKLREDVDAAISVDKEFELFMQMEKAKTVRTMQRARMFKSGATLVALALFFAAMAAAFYLLRKNPQLLHFGR